MEIKDWITIVSVLLIIIGWFINGLLNRRHEVFKKALEMRLEMLNSIFALLPFFENNEAVQSPELPSALTKAHINIQLFGNKKELDIFRKFSNCLSNRDVNGLKDNLKNLLLVSQKTYRKELNMRPLNLDLITNS